MDIIRELTTQFNLQTWQVENTVKLIESTAAKYASENSTNLVLPQELIKAGAIESDDGDKIYDPRNKTDMSCYLIKVEYKTKHVKGFLN